MIPRQTRNPIRTNKQPTEQKTMTTNTTAVIDEFINTVDKDKEYSLKELKDMLTAAFNAKKAAKPAKEAKPAKPAKAAKPADKPKKAPSAYNNYIKATIASLKQDEANKGLTNVDLMRKAAQNWKSLTKQEQEQYKTV